MYIRISRKTDRFLKINAPPAFYSQRSPKAANLRLWGRWANRPTEYAKRTCADYEERNQAAYAASCGEIRRRVQNPPLEDFELLLL